MKCTLSGSKFLLLSIFIVASVHCAVVTKTSGITTTHSDVGWGARFSEESETDGKWGPINALGCSGRYCDEMQKFYVKFRIGNSYFGYNGANSGVSVAAWTSPSFSDESSNTQTCPGDGIVTNIKCSGRYCDNLVIICATATFTNTMLSRQSCVWLSNEGHSSLSDERTPRTCGLGRFVSGLSCSGDYCDNKDIYCCKLNPYSCKRGYYGTNCSPCPNCNNGKCSEGVNGNGACTCNSGWEGTYCNSDYPECVRIPNYCPSNSACVDNVPGVKAVCNCNARYQKITSRGKEYCPKIFSISMNTPTIGGESFTLSWTPSVPVANVTITYEVKVWDTDSNSDTFYTTSTKYQVKSTRLLAVMSLSQYFYQVRVSSVSGEVSTLDYFTQAKNTYTPKNNLTTNCWCIERSTDLVQTSPNGFRVIDRYPSPFYVSPILTQEFDAVYVHVRDVSTCEDNFAWNINGGANLAASPQTTLSCGQEDRIRIISGTSSLPSLGIPVNISLMYMYIWKGQLQRSVPNITLFTTSWMAKFDIDILTASGGPVTNVDVFIQTGTKMFNAATNNQGAEIVAILPGNYQDSNPVSVTLSKILNNITHTFAISLSSIDNWPNNTYDFGPIFHKEVVSRVFYDKSLAMVSGYVLYEDGTNCGSEGVTVNAGGEIYTTDSTGFYAISVPLSKDVIISAQLQGHNITILGTNSSKKTLNTLQDITLNFIDHTRRLLNVTTVGGLCEFNIGKSQVVLTPKTCVLPEGHPQKNAQIVDGFQQFSVFPVPYDIVLLQFEKRPDTYFGQSGSYFSVDEATIPINFTLNDGEAKWVYRTAPEFTIYGLTLYKPKCNPENIDAIFKQGEKYTVDLLFTETYKVWAGDSSTNIMCPNVEVEVEIVDEISTDKCQGTHPCIVSSSWNSTESYSTLSYTYSPNVPNSDMDPYTKYATFTAVRVGDPQIRISKEIRVVVTGANFIGDKFTTNLPAGSVPILVLRKPPGGNSFSYFETGTTITQTFEASTGSGDTDTLNTKFFVGVEEETEACVIVGGGTCTSITNIDIRGGVTADTEISSNDFRSRGYEYSVSLSQKVTTSSDPNIIGDSGDIIYTPSILLIYSLARVVQFNTSTCAATVQEKVSFSPSIDANSVSAFYTIADIEAEIERLTSFVNFADISNYNRTKLGMQINNWVQILDYHRNTSKYGGVINNSIANINSTINPVNSIVTFTGGGQSLEYSMSSSSTQSHSFEVTAEIAVSVGAFLESEVAITKVNVGSEVAYMHTFTMTTGSTKSSSSNTYTTVGFSLGDPDPGDMFTVRLLNDPVYTTPIFELQGGQSSCPAEPGTSQLESASISTERPNRLSTPTDPSGAEVFNVVVQNTGLKSSTFKFYVNPVTLNGLSLKLNSDDPFVEQYLELEKGEVANIYVVAKNGIVPNYIFEQVELQLQSACDSGISYTLPISVKFLEPCPEATWANEFAAYLSAGEEWIVNKNSKNILKISVKNSEFSVQPWLTASRLKSIIAQYRVDGSTLWVQLGTANFKFLEKPENFGFVSFEYDVSILPDGDYCLRVYSECNESTVPRLDSASSQYVCGTVDRNPPIRFGTPKPVNQIWNIGDEISISFNEPLLCSGRPIFLKNVKIVGTLTSIGLLQVCEQRSIMFSFSPKYLFDSVVGKQIEITVDNIADLNRNFADNSEVFSFTVGNINLNSVVVYLQNLEIKNFGGNITETLDNIISELSQVFGSDKNYRCTDSFERNGTLVFSLTISNKISKKRSAEQETEPTTTQIAQGALEQESEPTTTQIAHELYLKSESGQFFSYPTLQYLTVPESTQLSISESDLPNEYSSISSGEQANFPNWGIGVIVAGVVVLLLILGVVFLMNKGKEGKTNSLIEMEHTTK